MDFDSLARLNHHFYQRIEEMLLSFEQRERYTVLDVGCGSYAYLAQTVYSNGFNHYIGIDINLEAVKKASKACRLASYVQADANLLPIRRRGKKNRIALAIHVWEDSDERSRVRILRELGKVAKFLLYYDDEECLRFDRRVSISYKIVDQFKIIKDVGFRVRKYAKNCWIVKSYRYLVERVFYGLLFLLETSRRKYERLTSRSKDVVQEHRKR